MQVNRRTYYSLVLLIVFSMNTLVSFACSASNLFHELHHHNTAASKAHHHEGQSSHVHDHSGNHHSDGDDRQDGNSDCCSNSVVEIQKVEKSVSRNIVAPSIVEVTSFFPAYSALLSLQGNESPSYPRHIRWRIPATIQDLRIKIQSFQI